MNTMIELKEVSFHYPGGNNILENINLKIVRGDYIVLTGPNGSAKTTLLKLILGSLKPQAGEVILFGQEAHAFRDWFKIGYVSQKTNFFNPSFPASVQEIIWLNKAKNALVVSKSDPQKEIEEVLDLVGLPEKRFKKIGQLSGGELQRVLIARALINCPEVLLLDEPTANLDKSAQENLSNLLVKLNSDLGLSVFMVTHDEKIKGSAKKILELTEGKLSCKKSTV
jgi:zinc transport system ATP-binding protein